MPPSRHFAISTTSIAAALSILVGCSAGSNSAGSNPGEPDTSSAPSMSATTTVVPRSPCPDELVIHTAGPPSAKTGFLYQLFATTPEADIDTQSVAGPIKDDFGALTGTRLRVRHGGSVVGFERPLTTLLEDTSIHLALVDTDELVAMSHLAPGTDSFALSVFAPYEVSDAIIFWDDDAHPGTNTVSDLKKWDIRVMYAEGAYFMDYFVSSGLLFSTQAVGALDDTPIPFIGSGGRLVKQGSSTLDPHAYRHLYRDWMKEISYQYIHDTGWRPYPLTLTMRSGDLDSLADCMDSLVPALQRAQRDFLTDPADTVAALVGASRDLDDSIDHPHSQVLAAVRVILDDELVTRSGPRAIGHQDSERIDALIELFARHVAPRRGLLSSTLESADIVTNRFIDPNITLGSTPPDGVSTTEIED